MNGVFPTSHPQDAQLWSYYKKGDFIDGYAVRSPLSPKDAAELAFQLPIWASFLLKLRNHMMRPFGLKTGSASSETLFPSVFQNDNEMIIGTDDYHLNFRISILQQNGYIHMATWVHRNNIWGRIYLDVIMPFHALIVRDCMKRIGVASMH